MAEQIPFGIAENLLMKLGSAVFHEIGLMYGVGGELRKLKEKLSTVGAVLLDAEEKQESSHAVADWVRRLKDVVYDADDLLDDFATEDLRRKTDDRGRFAAQRWNKKRACAFSSACVSLRSLYSIFKPLQRAKYSANSSKPRS